MDRLRRRLPLGKLILKGLHLQIYFSDRIKRRFKNHPLGILAGEVKNLVFNAPREINNLHRKIISLKPQGSIRGHVLLCYQNRGFFVKPGAPVPNDHTNRWEALQIAKTFQELGYQIDVIGEKNDTFVPVKDYAFFVGNRINFERIAGALNKQCVKVLHIDTAHWLFHNTAEHQRLLALQQRRAMTLPTRRYLKPNLAIEHADYATVLGNAFTIGTYRYAQKPIYRLPISSPAQYPWPEDKNFEYSRTRFLWIGSHGFVHKGLDLVLEAFAEMPDRHLTVCGPLDKEQHFVRAYNALLYKTPNIHTVGWVDIAGSAFKEIAGNCAALIYPSCSEGGGGSVISCMHAGLIPVVSHEASVDVEDSFGLVLKASSIEEIKASVRRISGLSAEKIKAMSRAAWEFARANNTRERFAEEYRKAILAIMSERKGRERAEKDLVTERRAQEPSTFRDARSTP